METMKTFRFYIGASLAALLLAASLPLRGQDANRNYVRTETWLDKGGQHKLVTVEYHDGLGRPSLSASDEGNPSGNFNYVFTEYDGMGRVSRRWLPSEGGATPDYKAPVEAAGLAANTYGDGKAFSAFSYDGLGRQAFASTPGEAWAGKGTATRRGCNGENEVKRYEAPLGKESLVKAGWYAAKTLRWEETEDADGHTLRVYRDRFGRTVLERRGGSNDTYYVYNLLGQLRYVLSPQYQESGYKDLYACEYRYDSRGNVAKKILPGCEAEQYWHDSTNRLVYMQDARLRERGLYRFFIYDHLGRLAVQGTCTGCQRSGDSGPLNRAEYREGQAGICGTGYVRTEGGDIENPQLEIAHYYDRYTFTELGGTVEGFERNFGTAFPDGLAAMGKETGALMLASDGTKILEAYRYDEKGRLKNTFTAVDGKVCCTQMVSRNYAGQVSSTLCRENAPDGETLLSATLRQPRDPATGLPSSLWLDAYSGNEDEENYALFTSYGYDHLGRQTKEVAGLSTGARGGTASRAYDLHGWVTRISGRGFTQSLHYADGHGAPCYNGNVSSMAWTAGDRPGLTRGYKFTYDHLDRLTKAEYGEGAQMAAHPGRYTEEVLRYTENGAIRRYQRHGLKADSVYGKIDNLNITLDGNRLKSVTDDALPLYAEGSFDFVDGAAEAEEYAYDGCGALTMDLNRGIANIEYDNLGHLRRITYDDMLWTEYVYDPLGRKWAVSHTADKDEVAVPEYGGGIDDPLGTDIWYGPGGTVYVDGALDRFLFPGGYATPEEGGGLRMHYYTCDHQGNIRVVMGEDGSLEQVTHYYPFGGIYGDAGLNAEFQPYKYNGKELDRMHGLDWYDYGARQYDAAGVPMFTTIDPMAEKYYHLSPYAYCANNPVKYIDKEGKIFETVWDVANVMVGVYSFSDNISQGNFGAAFVDGVGILADAIATALPILPGGAGAAIQSARLADKATDAVNAADKTNDVLKAMQRGRESEARILKEMGEVKNTQKYPATLNNGERINVIPDAVTDDRIIEIKDTKVVNFTKQIQGEIGVANELEKKFQLIIGENTHISSSFDKMIKNNEIEIIRRKDLGPQ